MWYEKWLRNFMIIIHQLLIVVYMPALHYTVYITHIKFTYTVTRLTSTLIKSVRCYKNDYHEKMINYNTCITISTIITCTQCTSI